MILLSYTHTHTTHLQTNKQTIGYYNAKALPSAGMVNLIQSYICSMDNPCLNREQYEEVPNYPNARYDFQI